MVVTVHMDKQRVKDIQRSLGDIQKKTPNVISFAMNRAITALAASVSKEIQGKYHAKPADIRPAIKRRRASASSLSGGIEVKGSPIGLEKFKVSPKTVNPKRKSQLKISVRKDRGSGATRGAFNANIQGLKVMKRSGRKRLPIDRLFGPSIPQMAKNEEIARAVNLRGAEIFEKNLKSRMKHLTGG